MSHSTHMKHLAFYVSARIYTHINKLYPLSFPLSSLLILLIFKCVSGCKYPCEGKMNFKLITFSKPLPDRMAMNKCPGMRPSQQGKDALLGDDIQISPSSVPPSWEGMHASSGE